MNKIIYDRIDEQNASGSGSGKITKLLKAEIEAQAERIKQLEGEKISLRYELDVLNESGAGTIQQLQAELQKAREYVPFSDDEIIRTTFLGGNVREYITAFHNGEFAVIKRAGLIVKEKE